MLEEIKELTEELDAVLRRGRDAKLQLMIDHAAAFPYLNKNGLISADSAYCADLGIHLRPDAFFRFFPSYRLEPYSAAVGGFGHQAVATFNGVRFFCLLDEEEFKEVSE